MFLDALNLQLDQVGYVAIDMYFNRTLTTYVFYILSNLTVNNGGC